MEFSHPDAVAQAVSIARSASGTQVDWTREPLTERERKIRQRWLGNRLNTALGRFQVSLLHNLYWRRSASDLVAAAEQACALGESQRRCVDQREFQEIADDLDRETSDGG
jgi:hypothetical protein